MPATATFYNSWENQLSSKNYSRKESNVDLSAKAISVLESLNFLKDGVQRNQNPLQDSKRHEVETKRDHMKQQQSALRALTITYLGERLTPSSAESESSSQSRSSIADIWENQQWMADCSLRSSSESAPLEFEDKRMRNRHQKLSFTEADVLDIADDHLEFLRLKTALKQNRAVTNEFLKQRLYVFVNKSKRRRSTGIASKSV